MKCPVCRAPYRSPALKPQGADPEDSTPVTLPAAALNCRRCGVDLAPLIRLSDQAIWHHRQAIQSFSAGDYAIAIAHNNQALALNTQQADFHALAGQLWALQGDMTRAIAAWKTAQHLNPQHPTATAYLQQLRAIASA
jgi:tetratricopeptide (TPR) repeat protein